MAENNRVGGGGGGGLFDLAKMGAIPLFHQTIVSIHKELECKVGTLKHMKLAVMQPKIKYKSKLPAHESAIPLKSL